MYLSQLLCKWNHKTPNGQKSDLSIIFKFSTWKQHQREEWMEGGREKVDGGQRWFGNSNFIWMWDLKLWSLLCKILLQATFRLA